MKAENVTRALAHLRLFDKLSAAARGSITIKGNEIKLKMITSLTNSYSQARPLVMTSVPSGNKRNAARAKRWNTPNRKCETNKNWIELVFAPRISDACSLVTFISLTYISASCLTPGINGAHGPPPAATLACEAGSRRVRCMPLLGAAAPTHPLGLITQ